MTFDTCRADRIGAFGRPGAASPAFDRLARGRSTTFARAYAHAPLTLPSHTSILTGLLPVHHGVRDNGLFALGEDATTLATVLAREGFATGAFVGAFPLLRRFGLDAGFDVYDDDLSVDPRSGFGFVYSERRAEYVVDAALGFVRAHRGEDFFAWVHFFDPHAPYDPPEPYAERFSGDAYAGEIAYADRALERLLRGLDDLGRLDELVVVATADHGEGLGDHGEATHGVFVYDWSVRVPLVVVHGDPGARAVVDSVVRLVDVFPTVLDLLGIGAPDGLDGSSVAPLWRGERGSEERVAYFESAHLDYQYGFADLAGVARGTSKWIDAPAPERYDLAVDPGETTNRAGSAGGDDLPSVLARIVGSTSDDPPVRERRLSREEARRLEALGYGTAGEAGRFFRPLLDPKVGIRVLSLLDEAQVLVEQGAHDRAEPLLASLLASNPRNSLARAALANLYLQTDRLEEAARENLRALEIHPSLASARRNFGRIRFAQGRLDEAETAYREALRVEPESVRALVGLARVLLARDRRAEAVDRLREAATFDPFDSVAHYERGELLAKLGERELALEAYERSVRARPGSPAPFLKIGSLRLEAGEAGLAEEAFAAATRQFPNDAAAWNALGNARFRLGRLEKAVQAFLRAGDLAPEAGAALANAGNALVRLGRLEEAEGILRRAATLERPSPEAMRALGILLGFSLNDRRGGIEWLAKYLELRPSDREARALLERLGR